MIITTSNKSQLLNHLTDLKNTITSCLRFGVQYSFPEYYNVADLKLDTGKQPKPVSNFEELLLLVQILLTKCEKNEFKKNPILFDKSIAQIEAIISNSLLSTDLFSANRLYRYIFGESFLSYCDSQNLLKSKHRFNLIYFILRYAIHSTIGFTKVIRQHIYLLTEIYITNLDYDVFILIFSFKFYSSELFARKVLLDRFYSFHELHWLDFQDITILRLTPLFVVQIH